MNKTWRESRTIAHWILKQLLEEYLKGYSNFYIIDNTGRVFVNLHGKRYMFQSSQTQIVGLQENSNYSVKQLSQAINLMMANGHLQMDMVPDDVGIEHIFFKVTSTGAIAYQESYYLKQIEERRNEWPKRNWPFVVVISFFFGSIAVPLTVKYIEKTIWPENSQAPKTNHADNYNLGK